MGIQYILDVFDHAPAMTAAEGLVLMAIAEETRFPGDVRKIDSATMTRRTRGMSSSGVRKALERLADRGIEARVPLGIGRDGRPYYSVPSQVPLYRLPQFPPPPGCACHRCEQAKAGPQSHFKKGAASPLKEEPQVAEGETPVPPSGEGGTTVPEGGITGRPGGTAGTPGGTTVPPSPFRTVKSPSLSAAEQKIADTVGATADETREIIAIIKSENPGIRSLAAYVARLADNGDLALLMNRVRSGARAAGPSSTPIPPGYARQVARPPCPHGVPGGHLPRPGTDTPACPQCRHATASAPPTTPQMHQRTLDAARDLATLRETLASLSSRPGLRRPALTIRPPGEAGPSPQVQAAHHYLTGRDDFDVWMNAARQRLGADATTGQVMVLAAELAKGE